MLPKNRKPSHPGEILKDLYMEPLELTQQALADHLGCTRAAISEIVNGRRGISPEMALKLSDAFNTSAELWENLQMDYDLHKAREKHKSIPPIVKIPA